MYRAIHNYIKSSGKKLSLQKNAHQKELLSEISKME
jgi:hypothetical protein